MMRHFRTINCILKNDGKILILKRSEKSRTNPGRWSGVAGEVEGESTPEETVYKEIEEETGIMRKDVRLVHVGRPLIIRREDAEVVVTPFLCNVNEALKVRLNWEHTEYNWIDPREFSIYDTVPRFDEVLRALNLLT
jgi:8-oxo-dGTP pyrophosphatase MutT (NUDIX family)